MVHFFATVFHQRCRGSESDLRRYRTNWIAIYIVCTLLGVSYYVALPTLHQFVTSSAHPTDPNVQPGLDLSETWYSVIVSISSLGELLGALLPAILLSCLYIKYVILGKLFLCLLGGILFGIGKSGWMLLIGRFLIGIFQGGHMAIFRVYIGETSARIIAMLSADKQKKSTIKNTAFLIGFAIITISVATGPGLPAVVAHIPHMDQFRWSGWYLAIHAAVVSIVVLVLFREKWDDVSRTIVCSRSTGSSSTPHVGIAYLLLAFFILNWCFSIPETLLNPILGDNFGFSIKYTSYVFLGTMIFFAGSTVLMYSLQKCGIDNRLIFIGGLALLFSGCIVSADWQSIKGDPCIIFSEENLQQIQVPPTTCCPSNVTLTNSTSYVVLHSNGATESLFPLRVGSNTSCTECEADWIQKVSNDSHVYDYSLFCFVNNDFDNLNHVNCFLQGTETELCVQFDAEYDTQFFGCDNNDTISNCNNAQTIQENVTLYLGVHLDHELENASSCLDDLCQSFRKHLDFQTFSFNTSHDNDVADEFCSANASTLCEAFSGPPFYCFWNPHSRIIGNLCPRCEQLCRSAQSSLNFVQFILGFSLIFQGLPIGRLLATIILSDIMGSASQSLVMGVMVAVGSASRFTGPLWGNAAYLIAGQRTYLFMSVLALLMGMVIALFPLLYRKLNRKSVSQNIENSEEAEEMVAMIAYDTHSEELQVHLSDANGEPEQDQETGLVQVNSGEEEIRNIEEEEVVLVPQAEEESQKA